MDLAPELTIQSVRCAPFHLALDADPIGSAGSYDAFMFVEVPLPWQRDVSADEPFRSLSGAKGAAMIGADGRRWRPQSFLGSALLGTDAPTEQARVMAFERAATSGAGSFDRREWLVGRDRLVELGQALLDGDGQRVASFDEFAVQVPAEVVDLFVCTHGRRDTCCGSYGTALFKELEGTLGAPDPGEPDPVEPQVRVWRVSHTGGHRFAPTALTFPDGYAWAHLDASLATRVARRDGAPEQVAPHCRGLASLDGGPAQAADRAALVEVGWRWLDATRHVGVTAFERETMTTTLRVDGELTDGTTHSFEVRVALERHVPQTTCGSVDGPEYGVEPVWSVVSVEPLGR